MIVIISIFVWIVIGVVIEGIIAGTICNELLIALPYDFYYNTKLNWFASWLYYILLGIINPFGFAIKLLMIIFYYIETLFSWLFIVIRKDD